MRTKRSTGIDRADLRYQFFARRLACIRQEVLPDRFAGKLKEVYVYHSGLRSA